MAQGLSEGLAGHWALVRDVENGVASGSRVENRGVRILDGEGAQFDGRGACVQVRESAFRPGVGPFSVAAWVHTEAVLGDAVGDIVSQFNAQTRTGFHLGVQCFAGVTSAQANDRHVYFGVDAGTEAAWEDCGRPGEAVFVCALAVCEGDLYAGTFETGAGQAGHVYRYAGDGAWADCGSPDPCNAVTSLAVFEGRLYAGVSHYRAAGSSLSESENLHPGGRIYRYEGGKAWVDCGKLGASGGTAQTAAYSDYLQRFVGWKPEEVDAIHGLAVYEGQLYAIPMYHQGVYRYEGGTRWVDCGGPGVRTMSLGVFNGHLYAAGNEGNKRGGVYRYDGGTAWTRTGDQPGVDQIYSFAIYEGQMYVGTWLDARVFRYDGGEVWTDCGKLGEELEVMGMAVYNGKLYAGSLPLAEVYHYDGGTTWVRTGRLDMTPDVKYRRAWSMAVYQGKLFCGTLPSGHVYSLQAGACATWDFARKPGWRHVAEVREGKQVRLYVDGREVGRAEAAAVCDLTGDTPLRIGAGANDFFNGKMRDVRVYNRALAAEEVAALGRG